MPHAILAPRQRDEVLGAEFGQVRLSNWTIQHRVGVAQVAEQEWNVEYADIREEIRQRSPGNECQIDRSQLHGLEHFDFATQGRIRILIDAIPAIGALGDLGSEHVGSGAELRIPRKDVAKLQGLAALRLCGTSGEATQQGGYGSGEQAA